MRVTTAMRSGDPDRIALLDKSATILDDASSAALLTCRWTDDIVEVRDSGDGTAIVYTRDGLEQRAPAGVHTWPLADVDAVLLMTRESADAVGHLTWHDLFELVAADGVQALVDQAPTAGTGRAAVLVMTETYESHFRREPPYSTLGAAERAMDRGDYTTAYDLFTSIGADQPPDAVYTARLGGWDALAKAGRFEELAEIAETDHRARRRLDRHLHDLGRADDLRTRAAASDATALYQLIRLLRSRGEHQSARSAVEDIAPADEYARELAWSDR
ncbi:hypothetical protein Q0Z83_028300 [Actinoplanes sichuanensis]|uniref:Tetratricopeptide repeat protein n=1 Tax=Actinoplanes sichuanensis TaxID=512349 RepID=A0ABW4AVU3_9ACTN|nr:hypothetical protein [Actinoplanes sichuanensis]BEL04639.1 hypothetical protein Q0Z83_028300 [Actinoplanes sichuanensis]